MRALGVALAAAALTLGSAPASADVSDYIGKIVASVKLEVAGRETADPKILDVIETRPGQPLSMRDVRESVTHLFSLGRFDDVAVHAALEGGRVALRYALVPTRQVTKIEFAGRLRLPGVDADDLRRAVVERSGSAPSLRRSDEAARLIAEQLHRRGYLHALVTPRADVDRTSGRATLLFTIEPGARTRIGAIEVAGPPPAARQPILDELDVAAGRPYERERLRQRSDDYVASRRARGFYEASVGVAVQLVNEDRVANLTFTVAPGPLVRVVFAGDPLPSDVQDELVPVEREGSVDEDLLEDASNRIEEYLRAQGYRDAAAPHGREETNGELLITFTVKRGPLFRVSRVEVSGNASITMTEFGPALRLRNGEPFASAKLEADLTAIESLYHRRGFAAARAEAGFEQVGPPDPTAAQVQTLVRITIREGVRIMVGSVRVQGNESVPEATLRRTLTLRPGQSFYPPQIALDRDALQLQYANLGYQNATIDTNPGLSADGTRADVVFTVHEGPRIFVHHVLIVGNVRTRTDTIERELLIKPGDVLGLQAVNESQRRLAALGLFRRTRLTELRHGDETTRDLLVTVEEAPVTTLGYGGGVEAGEVIRRSDEGGLARPEIDFAPRAFFEISRRNLFGKNRSVNLFGRISPHLTGSGDVASGASSGAPLGFTEYRLLGSFREPRVFDTGADASLTAVVEQQRRASFNFGRKSFIAEAGRRVASSISLSGSYQIQQTKLFDVRQGDQINPAAQLLIDRLFPQVRLSSFSSSIVRDTRDDAVDPGAGGYLSAIGQLAARRIGSEVGLAKSFLTAQAFRALPHTNRIVLAGNARIGIATGFPREVVRTDEEGEIVTGPDGRPVVDRVEDLPASERFFAGGDTMRGYALDQLGAPSTIDKHGFPIGGNALLIMNAELRVPIRGGVGMVGFIDTGNVFARARDFNLGDLRSAVGVGLRYRSPIGPIRVDLGFKLRRHTAAGRQEDLTAFHLSLGQAF